MTQWYVKEFSQLAGVSVQTLHHYEKIGLLKPSARSASGYRIYSELDLLHLQQIIALKFFGFELKGIKALLSDQTQATEHLSAQAQWLEQKANTLLEASKTLKSIINDTGAHKSIPWKTITQLIEVYQMTQQLEHTWVKDIFTADELKQYVQFENDIKSGKTNIQQEEFEKGWNLLVHSINLNLDKDPTSDIGIQLGQTCMELVNALYGKQYAHLRTKKFEQGFVEGKGLDEVGLTLESVAWLDKAMDAYWHDRLLKILNLVGKGSDKDILALWKEALDDMYGQDSQAKLNIYEEALAEPRVSKEAKAWLEAVRNQI